MNLFLASIKKYPLVFDGSKATTLYKMGLSREECPEIWNIKNPEKVQELYASYIDAGADVIQTNTFGANSLALQKFNYQDKTVEINTISVKLAKEISGDDVFVAASIGPTGKLLEPSGSLTFEDAYNVFKEQILAVTKAGADIINFETFSDINEIRAAILAARENSPLPIIASMNFEENGYTLMGNTPAVCALTCQSLGADMIGANCSMGSESLIEVIKQMNLFSAVPLCVKPNAGLPRLSGDILVYDQSPEDFKNYVKDFIQNGVRLIGGCCGTTPEHISAIREEIDNLKTGFTFSRHTPSPGTYICSSSRHINLDNMKKLNIVHFVDNGNQSLFKNQLTSESMDIAIDRAVKLATEKYDSMYLNLDAIGKPELLAQVTKTIQPYLKIPFIFHTSSAEYLESALRVYSGKAGVVVGNISDDTFELILSAKKYGSTIVDKSLIF